MSPKKDNGPDVVHLIDAFCQECQHYNIEKAIDISRKILQRVGDGAGSSYDNSQVLTLETMLKFDGRTMHINININNSIERYYNRRNEFRKFSEPMIPFP